MLFDSHTHIQFPEFDADRDAVIRRALSAGIWMVNVGTNAESSKKAVELAHHYKEGVYATVGIHPHDADCVRRSPALGETKEDADYDFAQIEELARDSRVVGIGETGLDYAVFVREQSERLQKRASAEAGSEGGLPQEEINHQKDKQKELFIKHIELAQKVGKPLIIHCRDAHEDLLSLLLATRYSLLVRPGVMHFFGGEGAWENLDEYLKMGFYISFAGVITFSNYKDAENIKKIPLERILIETDAPYVAPMPYRGKRNEPLYVKYVVEKLAEIKGVSFKEIVEQTTLNAEELFTL